METQNSEHYLQSKVTLTKIKTFNSRVGSLRVS